MAVTETNETVETAKEEQASEAAKELGKLGASKGGRARASVLTSEERKEIARKAVRTRWARQKGISLDDEQVSTDLGQPEEPPAQVTSITPFSLFQGILEIGNAKVLCHVLNTGKRVIAQREIVGALTGHVKGDISRYLDAQNLKPYINKDFILGQTLQFKIRGTQFLGNG